MIELGESVSSYQNMLSILDLSKVLVKGYVSPEDGGFIDIGSEVVVSQKTKPDLVIKSKITTINPALDETNKSIVANILLHTKDKWPKPGDNVRLQISANSLVPVITIPFAAVAYIENIPVVYVKKSEYLFEERHIAISRIASDNVIVSEGLTDGEEIAITQIFSLKALSRYEEYAE
jgi:cobalt-zinc-cadmium efflux system membrane fusion protein